MCFSTAQLLERAIKYWRRYGDEAHASRLEEELDRFLQSEDFKGSYYLDGFDYPQMLVVDGDGQVQRMEWGFLRWPISDPEKRKASRAKYPNLNATSERLFTAPTWKEAARNGRVVIPVDGFFEHHHRAKRTFPYFIYPKGEQVWWLAGIAAHGTFAIVTTSGNDMMGQIHNNPRLKGPRMPVILDNAQAERWLAEYPEDEVEEAVLTLCQAKDEAGIAAHPVGKLKGKEKLGNVPEVWLPVEYEELS